MSERQRYMAHPSAESVNKRRQAVCAQLMGFQNSPKLAERQLHDQALNVAEDMHRRARDGEVELPAFDAHSLFYYEIALAHITGEPLF